MPHCCMPVCEFYHAASLRILANANFSTTTVSTGHTIPTILKAWLGSDVGAITVNMYFTTSWEVGEW